MREGCNRNKVDKTVYVWMGVSVRERYGSPSDRVETAWFALVQPMIDRMKADGLLERNRLKVALGNAMHSILCGAGHNLRMILGTLRVLYFARAGLLTLLVLITPAPPRSSLLLARSENVKTDCSGPSN